MQFVRNCTQRTMPLADRPSQAEKYRAHGRWWRRSCRLNGSGPGEQEHYRSLSEKGTDAADTHTGPGAHQRVGEPPASGAGRRLRHDRRVRRGGRHGRRPIEVPVYQGRKGNDYGVATRGRPAKHHVGRKPGRIQVALESPHLVPGTDLLEGIAGFRGIPPQHRVYNRRRKCPGAVARLESRSAGIGHASGGGLYATVTSVGTALVSRVAQGPSPTTPGPPAAFRIVSYRSGPACPTVET
jgi:hypothetical protein